MTINFSSILYFSERTGREATTAATVYECGGGDAELEKLRDRYEGQLTASLYTGVLTVSVLANLVALASLFVHVSATIL